MASAHGFRWVFIIKDTASHWFELLELKLAIVEAYAQVLINEVLLKYGFIIIIIWNNETQFISAIVQKLAYCLKIKQNFMQVYNPEANLVERKNRLLKAKLVDHPIWPEKFQDIRFTMTCRMSSCQRISCPKLRNVFSTWRTPGCKRKKRTRLSTTAASRKLMNTAAPGGSKLRNQLLIVGSYPHPEPRCKTIVSEVGSKKGRSLRHQKAVWPNQLWNCCTRITRDTSRGVPHVCLHAFPNRRGWTTRTNTAFAEERSS